MQKFSRQSIDVAKLPPQVVEKWSGPVLTEGFVPVPKKLVRCLTRLFAEAGAIQELAVLLAIVDFKRPKLRRLPSPEFLAFLAGLEDSEFVSALRRLEDKGYVQVVAEPEGLDVSIKGLLQRIEAEAG